MKKIIAFFTCSIFLNQLSAQNMGIGTVSPTTKLHVFSASNPLRLEGLQSGASTDSMLTTDATGVVRKRTIASFIGSSGWSLTGNTGTSVTTNFIGTTDLQP